VLDARGLGEAGDLDRVLQVVGRRLLAVDVLAGAIAFLSSAARPLVVAASKNSGYLRSPMTASRSVAQRSIPCARASSSILRALRPTRIGSGITVSPLLSVTPPWPGSP
jgi:hypothetical protein